MGQRFYIHAYNIGKLNVLSLYHRYGGNVRIVFSKCYECSFCCKLSHYGDKKNPMWIGWRFLLGKQNAKVAILRQWIHNG